MVRVTLKNTFLSFEEKEEEEFEFDPARASSRQASPRSRSLECPSPNRVPEEEHGQIRVLNRLLDLESPHPSPSLRSVGSATGALSPSAPSSSRIGGDIQGLSMLPEAAAPAPAPAPTPQQRGSMGSASSSSQAPPAQKPHLPFGSAGPSAQELRQLQRRLEEACQVRGSRRDSQDSSSAGRGTAGCKVVHVASACSVSTMANESSEESEEPVGGQARARVAKMSNPPRMHQVQSTNSICSLVSASEQVEDRGEMHYGEETVEFDLTIEEGPQAHLWSSMSEQEEALCGQAVDAPWVCPRAQAPRASASSSVSASPPPRRPSPVGRGRGSGRASPGSSAASGASPRCRMYSPPNSPKEVSPRDSRYSQWRPLPKEYRHGHVPKNLNLAEEYKNSDQAAPPTTLMIRNIPNRYTQRELITELDDLGFQGTFDFLYIPLDKGTMSNVGYAFVNFVEPSWAEKCMAAFQNYRFKRHRKISGKIAAISVAHIQGLEANLAHYENAAVNTAKLKQRRPVIVANISQSLSGAILDES